MATIIGTHTDNLIWLTHQALRAFDDYPAVKPVRLEKPVHLVADVKCSRSGMVKVSHLIRCAQKLAAACQRHHLATFEELSVNLAGADVYRATRAGICVRIIRQYDIYKDIFWISLDVIGQPEAVS